MSLAKEFREFAIRGNGVDVAIGIVIGAGFTNLVNSFVKDVLMPPISLLSGTVNLPSRYTLLSEGGPYASLQEAEAAGAIVWKYGQFLNQCIDFLIVAFVIFMLVRTMNKLRSRRRKVVA